MKTYVCILLIYTFAIAHSQGNKSSIIIEKRIDNLLLRLTSYELQLKVGDTLNLNLDVINYDKEKSVVFFKPNIFPLDLDTVCWYVIEGGGKWLLNIGYLQPLFLINLKPMSDYHYEYRIAMSNIGYDERQKCRNLIATEDYCSSGSRYIVIYFGFYRDDGFFKDINIKELAEKGFDEERGFEFEQKLKRILLGPLHVLVEK